MKKVRKLGFHFKDEYSNNIKISHYYSEKPKIYIILMSLGLVPYLKNTEFKIDTTHPFGFSIHTENDKVIKISISPILFTLIKNYSLGCQVNQDCIKEVLNYIQ